MKQEIDVVILDDHLMVIKGLISMLESSVEINVKYTFTNGSDFLKMLETYIPDVLLLDINLPDVNGIELCKQLTKKHPELYIIAISNYNETSFIKNMMRNGAKGYLLKNTTEAELIEAITTVTKKETYLPESLKNKLLNESFGISSSNFVPQLTRRENEVLKCIADELTNAEIANTLFISIKTVESHRKNLLQKFGVRNTAGLIKEAYTKGLL